VLKGPAGHTRRATPKLIIRWSGSEIGLLKLVPGNHQPLIKPSKWLVEQFRTQGTNLRLSPLPILNIVPEAGRGRNASNLGYEMYSGLRRLLKKSNKT
jgi:hypothetical protein